MLTITSRRHVEDLLRSLKELASFFLDFFRIHYLQSFRYMHFIQKNRNRFFLKFQVPQNFSVIKLLLRKNFKN